METTRERPFSVSQLHETSPNQSMSYFVRPMMSAAFFLPLTACIASGAGQSPAEPTAWQPSRGHKQVQIWPGGAIPDARPVTGPETMRTNTKDLVAGKPWLVVENVSQPTMTV